RKEKKMFSSKDDEHFLLTGVKLKIKDDEKEKEKKDKAEKGHCFWESVTMTMRQISPTKKLEKMEGWEPPHLENMTETITDEAPEEKSQKGDLQAPFPDSVGLPLELASWEGQGPEEDSSHYANLSDSKDSTAAVRWTARAKVKLAGISRMSRGIVSESAWEGFK
uniref:Si:ch211-225h24.2 n=1 Tax=Mastacembelus armatus TaxID=205130 RepID=A0A3Q3N2H3_9TELE